MLLFCLKSVPWTGNELACENCENSQLTLTNLSHLLNYALKYSSNNVRWRCMPTFKKTLPRVVIHCTQVVEKKWKLRVRFSPTKENRTHQTRISTKIDKDDFSPAVFSSRLEQKIPVTECLVCFVCFFSSMAKSTLRMGSCVCFGCHNILFLRTMFDEGSPRSVL